jgi:uncharacterized membrane protein
MKRHWKWLGAAGGLLAGAAYLAFSYFVAASENPPPLAVVVGLLPMTVLLMGLALKELPRGLAWAGCVALVVLLLATLQWLGEHVAWVYLVQHVGAMSALGLMFGTTLRGGDARALCSQIAAFVTPEPLDAAYLHYTWQVTAAWTLFFLISALTSLALFSWGPVTWWSLFANVLTPVLTGAMFVVEYLVRIRLLPNRPHMSIATTVMAYQRFKQGTR